MRKILLLLGFGPALVLLAALALWRLSLAAPSEDMRSFELGGQKLRFSALYVRAAKSSDPSSDQPTIELMVLAPDFIPATAPGLIPPFGEPAPTSRAQIFITLAPSEKLDGAAALPPAERYAPYLSADAQLTEGGLLRRRFDDSSPFAGEDLYLAPPDGEKFFALCPQPQNTPDRLPETCLSTFRILGLSARMRFDPSWLPRWSSLRSNLVLLTSGAIQP